MFYVPNSGVLFEKIVMFLIPTVFITLNLKRLSIYYYYIVLFYIKPVARTKHLNKN